MTIAFSLYQFVALSVFFATLSGEANARTTLPHRARALAARTLPGSWVRQSCVTDDANNRALSHPISGLDKTNSATNCINACDAAGYTFAGVEYGKQCFCGNSVSTAGTAGQVRPDSECNEMPCTGYSASFCGGHSRMVIFHKGGSSSTPTNTTSTPPPSSGSGGKHKKASLAWPHYPVDWMKKWKVDGLNGYYTWTEQCVDNASELEMECFPMLWGAKNEAKFVAKVKPGYCTTVLGPNEPNQSGQSNMSPGAAVSMWNRSIRPLKTKYGMRLVSPATTCGPDGLTWMQNFFKICGSDHCLVDVIALHWYNNNLKDFQTRLLAYHNAFPTYKIWVTEFAAHSFNGGRQLSSGEVQQFMRDAIAWMEAQDWIERYFWFGALTDMPDGVGSQNQMMNGAHAPNTLGNIYLGKS